VTETVRQQIVALLPRLRRFACGLAGSLDRGDDLVQAACLKALSRLDQYQPGTRLDSWMFRIVQTTWIDQARGGIRRREVAMNADDLGPLHAGDAAREAHARLDLADVRRLVGALPPDQREVLMLVSVEELSYREAAEVLNIPIGTVMSRLARARIALGRAVSEERKAAS
jgi:RNA polymerase sigma-70 factor (ECF subfamily)